MAVLFIRPLLFGACTRAPDRWKLPYWKFSGPRNNPGGSQVGPIQGLLRFVFELIWEGQHRPDADYAAGLWGLVPGCMGILSGLIRSQLSIQVVPI